VSTAAQDGKVVSQYYDLLSQLLVY